MCISRGVHGIRIAWLTTTVGADSSLMSAFAAMGITDSAELD